MNRLDPRNDAVAKQILKRLPQCKFVPLVSGADLQEIEKVFVGANHPLEFPINSAGELIEKLGGADKKFNIAGVDVDPLRMIKYMPAYYFPIVCMENYIEKLAELVRQNRRTVDLRKEMENLRKELPNLKFPIANEAELLKAVTQSGHHFTFNGGAVDPAKIVKRIPAEFFPFKSRQEFENKIAGLMLTRPLIVAD